MSRTRIKICGVCRPEDALAAARAGADAVGLVLHPSARRFVSPPEATAILAVLPPFVTAVGLFVDAPASEVRDRAARLGLRHVQLHGHETPEMVAELEGLAVLKALRVERDTFGRELDRWREAIDRHRLSHLRGFVLETAGGPGPGGTGMANDWETVHRHQGSGAFDGLPPMVAAGGLTRETVGAVARRIRPWAVDVSSGVEEAMRIKSTTKIDAFVAEVRRADEALNP